MLKMHNYIYKDKTEMLNNSFLTETVNIISILGSVIGVAVWGGGINSRLKSVEEKSTEIDKRQSRIEDKLDNMQSQTNQLIHDCKNSIISVILDNNRK